MAQTKKQGMRLCRTENPRKKNSGWILLTAAALLSCTMLILSFTELTGFQVGNAVPVMLMAGAYLCIVYGLLTKYQNQKWFCPGVLLVLLIIILICRQQVLEGFCLFWNQMGDTMTAGTGWVLPELETRLSPEQSSLYITLFAAMAASVLAVIVCLLTAYAAPVLAVTLPGVLLAGMVFFGRGLSFPYLLPVLAVSMLILLYGGWGRKNASAPTTFSWLFCAAAVCILAAMASLTGMDGWAERISTQMHRAIHEYRYETEYSTLPEGDFTDYQQVSGDAEPALAVTMTEPEAMYLRGFTGCTFEDNTWKPIDTRSLAKNKDLLYWLNLNSFHPGAQFEAAASQTELAKAAVTIENIGACSSCLYVPFSLCDGEYLRAENLKTDSVTSNAERTYTYTAVSGGAEGISQTLEYLQKSNDTAVLRYRKAESAYRSFVYQNYVQVPEEGKELLAKYWDEIAAKYGSADNLTLQQAQECALTFLSQCFPDSGTPGNMELPLRIAEGTSYQYATVAVLTMRYFGIPARYAEGYVITEEMAAGAEPGASITVDSSCARAWVEVYQDGIGWIPMELTPGLGEMIQEEPDESLEKENEDPDSENLDAKEAEEETPTEEESDAPDPNGGTLVKIAKAVLYGFLIVLLILLLLFAVLAVRRNLLLKRKENKFRQEDPKEAISWIFADTALLLEKMGLDRGNGSMRQLGEPVRARFGEDYAMRFWNMTDLNDRAMFSSRELTQEQRESMLEFRKETLARLNTESRWYKRLWMKWIRCLY